MNDKAEAENQELPDAYARALAVSPTQEAAIKEAASALAGWQSKLMGALSVCKLVNNDDAVAIDNTGFEMNAAYPLARWYAGRCCSGASNYDDTKLIELLWSLAEITESTPSEAPWVVAVKDVRVIEMAPPILHELNIRSFIPQSRYVFAARLVNALELAGILGHRRKLETETQRRKAAESALAASMRLVVERANSDYVEHLHPSLKTCQERVKRALARP